MILIGSAGLPDELSETKECMTDIFFCVAGIESRPPTPPPQKKKKKKKTSMMWPSQNFLLYNGTVIKIKVNECINNYKKNMLR